MNSVSTSFVPPADWGRGLGLVLPSPSQPASLGESIWVGEILEEGEVCQALSEHRWSCTSCLRNHQVVCLGRRGRDPGLGAGSEEGIGVQKSTVEPCTVLAGGVAGHLSQPYPNTYTPWWPENGSHIASHGKRDRQGRSGGDEAVFLNAPTPSAPGWGVGVGKDSYREEQYVSTTVLSCVYPTASLPGETIFEKHSIKIWTCQRCG